MQTCYLVTSSVRLAGSTANGVSVLTSSDLRTLTGPSPTFEIGPRKGIEGLW